jgi:hypothetical protein
MSITSGITSSVKSIATSKVNGLLGGFPGAAALNGIMGKAFGKLIDGITSSINTIPILADVSAFLNDLGDSVFSALGGLGEAFGGELSDIVDIDGEIIGTESFLDQLTDITSSAFDNINLGQALTDGLLAGNVRAGLDSLINSSVMPALEGIGETLFDTVAAGTLDQLTDAVGDIPIRLSEDLPGGELFAGTNFVINTLTGDVVKQVIRDGKVDTEKLTANAANQLLKRVSGAAFTQVNGANHLLPSGADFLREFPVTEEDLNDPQNIIINDNGDKEFSTGAVFIRAAIAEAKLQEDIKRFGFSPEEISLQTTNFADLKIKKVDSSGNLQTFPVPDLRLPASLGRSAISAFRNPEGFIKNAATPIVTSLIERLAVQVFGSLPIPHGAVIGEAPKPFRFQPNTIIQQSVIQMRGGIEFDLNNAVDEAVTTALNPFSDALNNGIESVGEGFSTAVNTITPDVIRNTETFGTLFGIQKTNIDTLD